MSDSPLENLRVIELASVLAGPSVGMFFAEMGARVLKFENKNAGGDVTRSWKLPTEDPLLSTSAYFSSVNYRKEYVPIDLGSSEDRTRFLEQIKTADILLVNFKPGDAQKFGLSYSDLKQLNPHLIYGEITGFGEESERVAYDLVLQAESGFMSMNGTPDSGPVKMPVALIDILAGHQLKEGILIALLQRQKNGQGCKVEVSLFDAAVASLANQASNWLMAGHVAQRIGSLHPNIAPYGEIFTTADNRMLTLAIGTNKQFSTLLNILEISDDPEKFGTNQLRVLNRNHLAQILGEKIKLQESSHLEDLLEKSKIPYAFIRNIAEVFEKPEAKLLIREEEIDGSKTRRVSGSIFRISH